MFSGLAAFFVSMFSSSKLQDTAIDGLRKVGGLDDMNQREKADYILKYIEVSKHQSPIRRLIAFTLTALYSLVVVSYLGAVGLGYLGGYLPAMELSGALKLFLESVVVQPFNLVLSFYFVTHIASKFNVGK